MGYVFENMLLFSQKAHIKIASAVKHLAYPVNPV